MPFAAYRITAPGQNANSADRRAEILRGYAVLDTEAEAAFDAIVAEAAAALGTPMALVSLIDRHRQWFKARHGVDLQETALDVSICAKAIEFDGVFVVPDTSLDPRVNANPFVYGEPHIGFYAGAPLVSDGVPVGMVCVLDTVSRPTGITEAQREVLERLARRAMELLEARRTAGAPGPAAP